MAKLRLDFCQWLSMYSVKKKKEKKNSQKPLGVRDSYNELINFFAKRKDGMSILSCKAELSWYEAGNPYYKIWPQIATALGETNIDIDGKFLYLPFEAFEIRFPRHRDFEIKEDANCPPITSMLVYRDEITADTKIINDDRDWSLIVHYQTAETVSHDFCGFYYRMGVKSGRLLSDDYNKAERETKYDKTTYEPSKQFAQKLVRIAIATCFFGTNNHEMIMPDLPYKLEERYHAAVAAKDKTEAAKLLDKAKRLGHFGQRVGSELDLPRPLIKHINESGGSQGKYELSHGHLRSGHMRLQRYGSRANPQDENNPERYELIFIAPHLVRPDLPLRETRGYRIKDELLSRRGQEQEV